MNLNHINNNADFWRMLCFILFFIVGFLIATQRPVVVVEVPVIPAKAIHRADPWLSKERRTI